MQNIVFNDEEKIDNVGFADINSIDGRLTIGINRNTMEEMIAIQSIFLNKNCINKITLKNNGEIVNNWNGFTSISGMFFNLDTRVMIVWLRKE